MENTTYVLDYTLPASNGKRFANCLLDAVFVFLLVFLLGAFVAVLTVYLGSANLYIQMENMGKNAQLIFVVIQIIYYVTMESVFGRSLAKFITGTVVVTENGTKPSFGTIIKRTLCRYIPFDALSFFGDRGWHDSISKTYVVDKKELEESMETFDAFNSIGVSE